MTVKQALVSWYSLNVFLKTATEESAKKALEEEKAGKSRKLFLMRAHARYNRMRGDRERTELDKVGRAAK
jgi:hypothetical protein